MPSFAFELSLPYAFGIVLSSLRREIKVSQNWTDSQVREDTLNMLKQAIYGQIRLAAL
jgi:hypothetical protein